MIDVKLFRVVTGEEVMAEFISQDDTSVTIKNALVVVPTANGGVGFVAWASIIDKSNPELTISKNHIVYIAELDPQVKNKYNELYGSKLVVPDEKKLIL